MDTTKEAPPPAEYAPKASLPDVEPIDPTRDMNAKLIIGWLSFTAVGLFFCLILLYSLFGYVLQGERHEKIGLVPPAEFRALRENERQALHPPGGKQIEDSIKDYIEGK